MYCTCSNKKEVNLTIEHKPVKVCSKRLGGCGKEIGQYQIGIDYVYVTKSSIRLNRSMVGKKFLTRGGETVKLTQVSESDPYPYIFEMKDMSIITITDEGRYSKSGDHKYDIVEVL